MEISNLEGKTVRLTLVGHETLDRFIRPKIESNSPTFSLVARVDSVDQLGLWIKVPEYPTYDTVEEKQGSHEALVLLRFEYITSIVHFPSVEEDDEKSHRIGFSAKDEIF